MFINSNSCHFVNGKGIVLFSQCSEFDTRHEDILELFRLGLKSFIDNNENICK